MTSPASKRSDAQPDPKTDPDSSLETVSGTFIVSNQLGLHARAATKLVLLAARFPCEISIGREGQYADAKSVMGVLLLCGAKGTRLTIKASGPQAVAAVKQLGELIQNRFGEAE